VVKLLIKKGQPTNLPPKKLAKRDEKVVKRLAEIGPTWQLLDGKGAKILTKAVAKT
jgi:hypothetical protein